MTSRLWVNLPVKELAAAKSFYEQAGFLLLDEGSSNESQAAFYVPGQELYVMLLPQETFKGFAQADVAEPSIGAEVLFSLSADSKEQVENFIFRIEQAGGTVYAKPAEQNGMYGAGFTDIDGHRWNFLVMNE